MAFLTITAEFFHFVDIFYAVDSPQCQPQSTAYRDDTESYFGDFPGVHLCVFILSEEFGSKKWYLGEDLFYSCEFKLRLKLVQINKQNKVICDSKIDYKKPIIFLLIYIFIKFTSLYILHNHPYSNQYTLSKYSAIANTDTTMPIMALVMGFISTIFTLVGSLSFRDSLNFLVLILSCSTCRNPLNDSGVEMSEYLRE